MRLIKANENKFIDEKFGIIKSIYDLPTYPGLPRVYVKMSFGSSYATSGFNSSGAGITKIRAKNAAVGEYIERYSLLHPNVSKKSTASKYIFPHMLNPTIINSSFSKENLHWQDGLNLMTEEKVALPYENIYLNYKKRGINKDWVTTADGAACGENTFQIIWKCIAEVLERDAFVTNWRYQMPSKKIDITANSELMNFYQEYIETAQVKISLYKLEMDWSAPTVFGVAELANGSCVVSASTRDTWIAACKKTLLELAQSLIGYASVLFNRMKIEPVTRFEDINDYQDHSALYFNPNMARHLDFFDSGSSFIIPESEPDRTDEEKTKFFLTQLKSINSPAYYTDVTAIDILPYKNWHVGRVLIPDMLDVEPNYIPTLKRNRLVEAKNNMIKFGKKKHSDFHSQPNVPHPFP